MAGHLDRNALQEIAQQRVTGHTQREDDDDPMTVEAWQRVKGREDEVYLVAQSLAFLGVGPGSLAGVVEEVTPAKVKEMHKLLISAYADEATGDEAYRRGELVDIATVDSMLRDPQCRWLCCEAVSGRGVDDDGALLGTACVSLQHNKCATIRFLAIQPKLRGLCVGHRLLQRVERALKPLSVTTLLVCIPSTRKSMQHWAHRRGFNHVDTVPFPVENLRFDVFPDSAKLLVYAKDLRTKLDGS